MRFAYFLELMLHQRRARCVSFLELSPVTTWIHVTNVTRIHTCAGTFVVFYKCKPDHPRELFWGRTWIFFPSPVRCTLEDDNTV